MDDANGKEEEKCVLHKMAALFDLKNWLAQDNSVILDSKSAKQTFKENKFLHSVYEMTNKSDVRNVPNLKKRSERKVWR